MREKCDGAQHSFRKSTVWTNIKRLRNWFDKICPGAEKAWQIWLQDHAESLPFYPENAPALNYTFAQFDVEMPYKPGDFTQINAQLNEVMVARAVRLLNPQKGERIADLFCGLGNFSLPLAKSGASVVGIEGADYLVDRARENARLKSLCREYDVFLLQTCSIPMKRLSSHGEI